MSGFADRTESGVPGPSERVVTWEGLRKENDVTVSNYTSTYVTLALVRTVAIKLKRLIPSAPHEISLLSKQGFAMRWWAVGLPTALIVRKINSIAGRCMFSSPWLRAFLVTPFTVAPLALTSRGRWRIVKEGKPRLWSRFRVASSRRCHGKRCKVLKGKLTCMKAVMLEILRMRLAC